MPVTNLLKPQVDLPVFEWMRFAPEATIAGSCTTISEDGRYIYFLLPKIGMTFYRYDTVTDSWQELLPPTTNVTTGVGSIQYTNNGNRGPVLSATSNTIKIAGIENKSMVGMTVRIVSGKGAGQSRTITAVSDLIIHDSGVVSGVITSFNNYGITDSTKKWKVNQWVGYALRPTMNTGTANLRKILYNTTTSAYTSDPMYTHIDPWNGGVWLTSGLGSIPSTTAPATLYQIESIDLTVDSPWTDMPDSTSVFEIMSGTVWFLSSETTVRGIMYCYDVLTNTWMYKNSMQVQFNPTSLGTDYTLARVPMGVTFISGVTATSAAAYSIGVSGGTMEYDRYANHGIVITSGKGVGQERRIVSNSDTTFYIDQKWGVTPDTTSQYAVRLDASKIWLAGSGSAGLYYYDVERNTWSSSHIVDHGTAKQISLVPYAGSSYEYQYPGIPASAITYNASGVVSVSVGTTTGVNYQVGDLLVLNNVTGGTGAKVYVTGITGSGLVTSLSIANSGFTYTGTTATVSGGSGSGLIVSYTSGKVGNIVTGVTHYFSDGLTLTIAGCTTDLTFNNNLKILGVDGSYSLSVAADASAAASPTALRTQSTTQIVDAKKNWDVNEHRGRTIHLYHTNNAGGLSSTYLGSRKISTNTSTSIVWEGSALTAPTNGYTCYIITDPRGFGAALQYREPNKAGYGWTTAATTTTLTDASKNWIPNMFVNCRIRIVSGTGLGNESVITANTTNTVTVASWANATPDTTSKYEILDTFGIATSAGSSTTTFTDTAKNWQTNYLAGKRIRFISGSGIGNEYTINSNTTTTLTLSSSATFEAVAANGTQYVIYDVPAKSTGCFAQVLHNLSDSTKKGRFLITARGASAYFDIYDIPTNTWKSLLYGAEPTATTLTTGSMYAYDDADRIIFTKDATGRLYSLNCITGVITATTITPYAHGTALVGNRMEVLTTADGLKYLYLMRHSGQEMWRTLVFWS